MSTRQSEMPEDPRVERDLDALERALAGRPVDPDQREWAELATLLAEERPRPRDQWTQELDERVAARFGRGPAAARRFRLSALLSGRMLAPAGALATLAIVVVVAVSTLGGAGTDETGGGDGPITAAPEADVGAIAPEAVQPEGQGLGAAKTQFRLDSRATLEAAGGKIAPGTEQRRIERDVQLTLSTAPDEVRDVSDQVVAITRSLDGIVASSQVTETEDGSRAMLALTIPTRNLDAAIDRLTELANVESMSEATQDITRPFVSARDRLRDAREERRGLLEALANATTDAEAAALQERIDDARRKISRAEAAFERVARRARLSDLNVTVAGDPDAADHRSLSDWLEDAVDVLRTVLGVLLVSAAILIPLGLLVALGIAIVAVARRRRRERALDDQSS